MGDKEMIELSKGRALIKDRHRFLEIMSNYYLHIIKLVNLKMNAVFSATCFLHTEDVSQTQSCSNYLSTDSVLSNRNVNFTFALKYTLTDRSENIVGVFFALIQTTEAVE